LLSSVETERGFFLLLLFFFLKTHTKMQIEREPGMRKERGQSKRKRGSERGGREGE
jgi:hypothetical protein